MTAAAAPEPLPEVPELPRRRRAPGSSITGGLVGRARDGVVTTGKLVTLGVDASVCIATDIVRRRFSWSEFLLQAWFMTRVSLLPTILVAIPFGVITSVQIGAVAAQIGATSFSGAVNGIGVLRQGAPLVTSLKVLDQIDARKLHRLLVALSTGLGGTGEDLGNLLDQGQAVLTDLDRAWPQTERLLRNAGPVLDLPVSSASDLLAGPLVALAGRVPSGLRPRAAQHAPAYA